jgi:hypothetical protein
MEICPIRGASFIDPEIYRKLGPFDVIKIVHAADEFREHDQVLRARMIEELT